VLGLGQTETFRIFLHYSAIYLRLGSWDLQLCDDLILALNALEVAILMLVLALALQISKDIMV
jgi:hypothetical protein